MVRLIKYLLRGLGRMVLGTLERLFYAVIVICTIAALVAYATNYSMTQGSGTTFGSLVVGGVNYAQQFICDLTTPAQCAAVSAGGAVKVDNSAVTQPANVTQFGGTNVSTGTGASGAGIPRVTVANDSNVLATQSGTWNVGTLTTVTNPVAVTESGTWTVQPGNTPNTSPWLATVAQGGNSAVVKAGNTAGTTDVSLVVSDPNVLAAVQAPIPAGSNAIGSVFGFGAVPTATVTRPANTTTYNTKSGWCGATAACATVFTFSNACRANGGLVLIPEIDIWSSNVTNPVTPALQGILWLFTTTPGTIINDNATFNIAAADFATLTGNQQGFPFTLAQAQATGAVNNGVSLTGTTYHAQCGGGTTTLIGMVEVVNAYVPVSNEVLHVTLHTVGVN